MQWWPCGQEKPIIRCVSLKRQFLQHLLRRAVNYNSIKIKQLHTISCPYFLINLCKRKTKIPFFSFQIWMPNLKKIHCKQWPVPHLRRDQLEGRMKVTCTQLSSSGIGDPRWHQGWWHAITLVISPTVSKMTGTVRCWLREELTGKTLEFVHLTPAHDRWWNLKFC